MRAVKSDGALPYVRLIHDHIQDAEVMKIRLDEESKIGRVVLTSNPDYRKCLILPTVGTLYIRNRVFVLCFASPKCSPDSDGKSVTIAEAFIEIGFWDIAIESRCR